MESSKQKQTDDTAVQTTNAVEVEHSETDLKGDYKNVALLLLLYLLQGVPIGIAQAIPILLQNRGVTYADQAKFSIVLYPFGLKLLWAPIIDSVFIKSFGRRKTWICAAQIVLVVFMIYLSYYADEWMGSAKTKPQIGILTAVFFILILFSTVQDVAVDGWALTLLQRRNVGYASTTNNVGLSIGRVIGFTVLLLFESKDFSNKYIFSQPRDTGLFTLSEFFMFWACFYLIVTTLVAIFKYECPENAEQLKEHSDYGLYKAYLVLLKIIKLKPVIEACIMIFTLEACFAASNAILSLKLIEYGVSKEKVALISIPSGPVEILFPLLITKYTAGRKPLSFYYKAVLCKLVNMIFTTALVFTTPMALGNENFVVLFYVGLIMLLMIDTAMFRAIYTAHGSFFAKIADPLVGGSYMTLLYTFGNFGNGLFKTISLWVVDLLTWKQCNYKKAEMNSNFTLSHLSNNTCSSKLEKVICTEIGGTCDTKIDGFYIEIGISLIYGLIWYKIFKSVIYRLQRYAQDDWYVLTNKKSSKTI